MICDEINLFETFDNVKHMDLQYFYTLGMLDSSYDIGVVSSTDYQELKRTLKYEIVNDTIYIIVHPHTSYGNFYDWGVRLFTDKEDEYTKSMVFGGQRFENVEQLKKAIDERIELQSSTPAPPVEQTSFNPPCDPITCTDKRRLENALEWACEELQKMCLIVHKDDYEDVTTPLSMGQWFEEALRHTEMQELKGRTREQRVMDYMYYKYLRHLRDVGMCYMCDTHPYLKREFPQLKHREVKAIIDDWTDHHVDIYKLFGWNWMV